MRFYVFFNSFSDISGRLADEEKAVCNGTLFTGGTLPRAGLQPGTAR